MRCSAIDFRKWISSIIALFVLLIMSAFIGYWYIQGLLTTEYFEQILADSLNRKVQIESAKVSFENGVRLRGLKIAEESGWDDGTWLKVHTLNFKPRYLPLLWGQVEISSSKIANFQMNATRGKDGTWNLPPKITPPGQLRRKDSEDQTKRPDPVPVDGNLRLHQLRLINGTVTITNQQNHRSIQFKIGSAILKDFDETEGGNLQIQQASLAEATIQGSSRFTFNPFSLRTQNLLLQTIDVQDIQTVFPELDTNRLPLGSRARLTIRTNRFQYKKEQVDFSGKIELDRLQISPGPGDSLPIQNATWSGTVGYIPHDRLSLHTEQLQLNQNALQGTADINLKSLSDDPTIQGSASYKQLNLSRIRRIFDVFYGSLFSWDGSLDGNLRELNLRFTGQVQNPHVMGNLDIRQFRLRGVSPGQFVDADQITVMFRGRTINLDSSDVHWPGGQGSITASLTKEPDSGSLTITAGLTGRQNHLDTAKKALQPFVPELSNWKVDGTIRPLSARVSLKNGDVRWRARGNSRGTNVTYVKQPNAHLKNLYGSLMVSDTAIVLDSATGQFRNRPFRLNARVPLNFSRNDRLLRNGPLEVNGRIERVRLQDVFNLVGDRLPDGYRGTGSLSLDSLNVKGDRHALNIDAQTKVSDLKLNIPAFDRPFQELEGSLRLQGSLPLRTNIVSDWQRQNLLFSGAIRGRWGDHLIRAEGVLPMEGWKNPRMNITARVDSAPVETFLRLMPDRPFPASIALSGPVSFSRIHLGGTITNPTIEATMEPHDLSVQFPFLEDPLESVTGRLHYDSDTVQVDQIRGKLGNHPLAIKGILHKHSNRWEPQLRLSTDTLPISLILEQMKEPPTFPSAWQPGGLLQLNAHLEGDFQKPRINGTYSAPRVSFGNITARNIDGRFHYDQDKFSLSTSDTTSDRDNFKDTSVSQTSLPQSRLTVDGKLEAAQLQSFVSSFDGIQYEPGGKFKGQVNLSGTAGHFTQFSGSIEVQGSNLNLKNIPALRRLSVVLNTSLGQALESSVVGTALNILTFNFFGDDPSALSLFSSDITTKFKTTRVNIKFKSGEGQIYHFTLENPQTKMNITGKIWLDGRIDATVIIKPRTPILNKIEKDWLRGVISGGFPEFKVSGTLQNPSFNTDGLQKGLQGKIQQFLVSVLTFGFY